MAIIAECLNRSRQPIYNVINFLKLGQTALDFYTQYKKNKQRCGRRKMVLPMKGKRKPNGHQERRGKQAFKRHIFEREVDYPSFQKEFGHTEGDTNVGARHKSAVITLVERLTKVIIALKFAGRKACRIETALNQ